MRFARIPVQQPVPVLAEALLAVRGIVQPARVVVLVLSIVQVPVRALALMPHSVSEQADPRSGLAVVAAELPLQLVEQEKL